MAISPNTTFRYTFLVEPGRHLFVRPWQWVSSSASWCGDGSGLAAFGCDPGLVGVSPRFVLEAGWLTLLPREKPAQSFPAHWFHDSPRTFGKSRELKSYALFVGKVLQDVLRAGDTLEFSRDGNGDFSYRVKRSEETIFAAGTVNWRDGGESCAVWQESDRRPNPHAEPLKIEIMNNRLPPLPLAEWTAVRKPFVTVRVKEQIFRLSDGDDVSVWPYYVFLARANKDVPETAFEFFPRAVHSFGRSDLIAKEFIKDTSVPLLAPKTRMF